VRFIAVIPAFNEEEGISDVVRRTLGLCELLVIDDGSKDDTALRAEQAGARVHRLGTNRGKTFALETGFDLALADGADAVVTLDADGQHLPEEIPRFLSAAEEGADIVIGSRMGDVKDMPWMRLWTNQTTSRVVSWLARTRIFDSQSGFRLFRAGVIREVEVTSGRFAGESEILIEAGRKGYRIAEVPISTVYFGTEGSKIDPFRDTVRFFRLAASYL
jgi:glycosyltransferase involved in cell wall biosynthesis